MPWTNLDISFFLEVAEWLIRGWMFYVVISRPQRPVVALAWLAVSLTLPWLGLLLYFLIGERRLGRKRARKYVQSVHLEQMAKHPGVNRAFVAKPQIDEHQRRLVNVAESLVGMPILGGNQVDLMPHTAKFVDRLIEEIDGAKTSVHLLYFIFEDDDVGRRVGAALARAAQRGVKCRVLADAAGSFFFFSDLADRLEEQGVEVRANLPVRNLRRLLSRLDLRNHRKLAIIDGLVAYTGSHNIVRASIGTRRGGTWQDLTARIVGPTVNQLQAVFLDDWCFETEESIKPEGLFPPPHTPDRTPIQVVPTGPSGGLNAIMRDVIIEALHSAHTRVIITTPYFVPDEALVTALRLAAARGVQVDVVMPHASDNVLADAAARSYFAQLLDAKVNMYLNRAGMLHAKTMTVDDGFSMIGSANFDIRSFFLNFELNLLLYEQEATAKLRFVQSQYIMDSEKVTAEGWKRRPTWRKLTQNAAMLLSPLL
ncbi:MAG TPA: cardiolipin synthase [Phycisphaerales bacterium]|nr:cardiolipin synthase [Phycisphaerales bacterium]